MYTRKSEGVKVIFEVEEVAPPCEQPIPSGVQVLAKNKK